MNAVAELPKYIQRFEQLELDFDAEPKKFGIRGKRGKRVVLPFVPVCEGLDDEETQMVHHNIHQWVFEESMTSIHDGDKDALEVVEWMFSPDVIDRIEKVPGARSVYVRRHQADIPFSFYRCCKALNYDPETYRSEFAQIVQKLAWFKNLNEAIKTAVLRMINKETL